MATIPGILAAGALRHPERAAVVFGERSYSYAGLDGAVNRAAHALGAAGLRKGDRMLLMSGNSDRFIIALYSALRLGALVVPVNPASAAPELLHILDDSGASLLVFGDGAQSVVRAAGGLLAGAPACWPVPRRVRRSPWTRSRDIRTWLTSPLIAPPPRPGWTSPSPTMP
jgi:acyl-CoA synthetase (AMP-forming)/AMP-acid ligase II